MTSLIETAKNEHVQAFAGQIHGSSKNGIDYDIVGDTNPRLLLNLDKNQELIASPGKMTWWQDGIDWRLTGDNKGIGGFFNRAIGGEPSVMLVELAARGDHQHVSFAAKREGSILPIQLKGGESIIVDRGSFLAAEKGVNITFESQITRRPLYALFGEGLFLQKITAPAEGAMVWLNPGGIVEKITLDRGESLHVDNRKIAARAPDAQPKLEGTGFLKSIFGGLGLTTVEVQGPGEVYLQHKRRERTPDLHIQSSSLHSSHGMAHSHHASMGRF